MFVTCGSHYLVSDCGCLIGGCCHPEHSVKGDRQWPLRKSDALIEPAIFPKDGQDGGQKTHILS